ncbi:MAG: oligosaccharide repeat unit polymerase [Bacteroidales bacterium]|nr:oligosaccharide repeat unit polymerase [Bacteroidales bacterium]
MLLGYIILNIIFIVQSVRYYKRIINPISIYSLVWGGAILIHQSGLIYYNEFLVRTWLFIIISYMCFCISCLSFKSRRVVRKVHGHDDRKYKQKLNRYILITMFIAAVGILSSVVYIISIYGTNLIYNITNIYAARVNEGADFQVIPYVSSFIYITLPLSGIYVRRYGMSKWVICAFVLVALNSLTSGARAGIVFSALLFVFGYITSNKGPEKNKKDKPGRMGIWIGSLVLFAFFILISQKRSAGNELSYATDLFYRYFGDNVLLYKIFTYVANPIGVLNEYIKDCEFSFGKNTFLPIYNILAKFGVIGRVEQYQSWYNVPAECNVGTWLRELSEDFTWIGALVFISIYAYVTSGQFIKTTKTDSTSSVIITSLLLMTITLSFFDWKLRTSGVWIALAFGMMIGNGIDKSVRNNG